MKIVWYDVSNRIISTGNAEVHDSVPIPDNAAYLVVINSDDVPGEVVPAT
jgi:hypothetical protein